MLLTAAPQFEAVQKEVADILKGRTLVGHAITNDMKVRAGTWSQPTLVVKMFYSNYIKEYFLNVLCKVFIS